MVNIELKIVSTKVNVFEQMECQFFFKIKTKSKLLLILHMNTCYSTDCFVSFCPTVRL